jgi:hypothetical protein
MADEQYLQGDPTTFKWGQGEWQGAGGGDQAQKYAAWQNFAKIFGRNPTQSELAMFAPAFGSGDPNKTNNSQGTAAIAQYFQGQQQTPDKLAAQQQAEYLKNAPKHFDEINQLFQGQLGRLLRKMNSNHFGSALASGNTDAYQLQQFLQEQPEFQTKQNEQMRQGLSSTMAANDKRQFSEQILPSIQEAYAKQGRSFDSSAFANSAAQAAQQQNTTREGFLNNLTAQQYGGVQDRAYQDYANQVANSQNLTNQGIQARYSGIQNSNNRINQISDYNMQAQAYNQYLSKYGKRNNGLGGMIGTLAGAGIGGYFGGTAGAQLGATLGGTTGTAAQNSGGSY